MKGTIKHAAIVIDRGEQFLDVTIRVPAPKFDASRKIIDHAKAAETMLGKEAAIEVKP